MDWMLIGFAMLTGFIGGLMYTREVYMPLVAWMHRTTKGGGQRDS